MSSCEMVSNLPHLQETATFYPEEQALFFREFQANTKWAWSVERETRLPPSRVSRVPRSLSTRLKNEKK